MHHKRPPHAFVLFTLLIVSLLGLNCRIAVADGGTDETLQIEVDGTPEFTTVAELDGKNIGCLNGSIADKLFGDYTHLTVTYSFYNLPSDMCAALKAHKIDGAVLDLPVARLAASQNPGITLLPQLVAKDNYGFIFKKGNPLCQQATEVIDRLRADGTLDKLADKWCGSDEGKKTMPVVDWDTSNGTLSFVTSGTVEPMNYMRGEELVGYDVELAMIIARELNYDITFTIGDYAAILGNVQTGKSDFGGNALSITDERKQIVDFTSPVYEGAITIIIRDLAAVPADTDPVGGIAASFRRTFIDENRWMLILQGLGTTVVISVVAGALGILVGFLCVLARRSEMGWLSRLVDAYQALIGDVPLVVILMFFYYVVFGSFDVPGTLVAIIAFTLSFGSTAASTMWTALSSLDIIQEETGMALGFRRPETFRHILFPQAASVFMPQLAGQFVGMVKETAIVGYIAVLDLTRASDLIRSRTMDAFFPLVSTALIYFLFCRVLAWVLGNLVKRLDKAQRPQTITGVTLDDAEHAEG